MKNSNRGKRRPGDGSDIILGIGLSAGEDVLLSKLAKGFGFRGPSSRAKVARLLVRIGLTDPDFIRRGWEKACEYSNAEGFESVENYLDGLAGVTVSRVARSRRVSVLLSAEVAEGVKTMAARLRVSRAWLVRQAVKEILPSMEADPEFASDIGDKSKG